MINHDEQGWLIVIRINHGSKTSIKCWPENRISWPKWIYWPSWSIMLKGGDYIIVIRINHGYNMSIGDGTFLLGVYEQNKTHSLSATIIGHHELSSTSTYCRLRTRKNNHEASLTNIDPYPGWERQEKVNPTLRSDHFTESLIQDKVNLVCKMTNQYNTVSIHNITTS